MSYIIDEKFFRKVLLVFLIIVWITFNTHYLDSSYLDLSIETRVWASGIYRFLVMADEDELEKLSIVLFFHLNEQPHHTFVAILYLMNIYLYLVSFRFMVKNTFSSKFFQFLSVLISDILVAVCFFWLLFCLSEYFSYFATNVVELHIRPYYNEFSPAHIQIPLSVLILLALCSVLFLTCLDNFLWSFSILFLLFYDFFIDIVMMIVKYPFPVVVLIISHMLIYGLYLIYVEEKQTKIIYPDFFKPENIILSKIEYFKRYLKGLITLLLVLVLVYFVEVSDVESMQYQFFIHFDTMESSVLCIMSKIPIDIETSQFLYENISDLENRYLTIKQLDHVDSIKLSLIIRITQTFFLIDFIFHYIEKGIIGLIYYIVFFYNKLKNFF